MISNRPQSCYKLSVLGFTLIELLVVILIIGILAAIALPQYQFSVEKSKLMQNVQLLRDLKNAEMLYFLEYGYYTTAIEDLDIYFAPISVMGNGITRQLNGQGKYNGQNITCVQNKITVSESSYGDKRRKYVLKYDFQTNNYTCIVQNGSAMGERLCRSLEDYTLDLSGSWM